jgi:fructose-1,6-bisphosphatase I
MEPQCITVEQHILQEQTRFPDASGSFSWLLSGLTLATKLCQAKVRRAGLTDLLGAAGAMNVQGEQQQRLDIYANQCIKNCLAMRENIAMLVSEEDGEPIIFNRPDTAARYAVIFDPLDGSSNIDVNVSVGTIFSILRMPSAATGESTMADVLQPGVQQVAAGYVVYGPSTILVYAAHHGVHGFTLDPAIGAYVLSHPNIRMPPQGQYYSVNEANRFSFPKPYGDFLDHMRGGGLGRKYSSRYIGSLAADFHRNLLKGGIFLYPPTTDNPRGKLRLLYEVNPIAFIAEQAGGRATDGVRRILDIQPTDIHQRVPLVVGSETEMAAFEPFARRLAEL